MRKKSSGENSPNPDEMDECLTIKEKEKIISWHSSESFDLEKKNPLSKESMKCQVRFRLLLKSYSNDKNNLFSNLASVHTSSIDYIHSVHSLFFKPKTSASSKPAGIFETDPIEPIEPFDGTEEELELKENEFNSKKISTWKSPISSSLLKTPAFHCRNRSLPEVEETPYFMPRKLSGRTKTGFIAYTSVNLPEIIRPADPTDFLLDEKQEKHYKEETRNVYGIIPTDSFISEGDGEDDELLAANDQLAMKHQQRRNYPKHKRSHSITPAPFGEDKIRRKSTFYQDITEEIKQLNEGKRSQGECKENKEVNSSQNKSQFSPLSNPKRRKEEPKEKAEKRKKKREREHKREEKAAQILRSKTMDLISEVNNVNGGPEEDTGKSCENASTFNIKLPKIENKEDFSRTIPIPMTKEEISEQMNGLLDLLDIWNPPLIKPIILQPPLDWTPNGQRKKCLILDLDGTLIYKGLIRRAPKELVEQMRILRTPNKKVCFSPRPFAQRFLLKMSKYFEIVIYSAGEKEYVEQIMKVLTHKGQLTHCVSHILHRDHCFMFNNYCLKTIGIMNRDPKSCIVLDDNYLVWPADLNNLIPISGFFGDQKDRELRKLVTFLIHLAEQSADVRTILKYRYELITRSEAHRDNKEG